MPVKESTPKSAEVLIEAFKVASNIRLDGSNSAQIIPSAALEIKKEAQAIVNNATGNGK